jgi:secreted trypsin-like serine protease
MRRLISVLFAGIVSPLVFAGPALAVFGGQAVHDGDLAARSVAAIRYQDATGVHLCTAAVLGPRLVLTAAHCTAGDRGQMLVLFTTSLVSVADERTRTVADVALPAAMPDAKAASAFKNPDDIALILLDRAAPADAVPVALQDAAPAAGRVAIVGYGATSELRTPLGAKDIGFDQVLRVAAAPVKSVTDSLIVTDQTAGAGACTGDSGGPAFASRSPGPRLLLVGTLIGVGAPKSATDYCRGSAYYTNVAHWMAWIASTAAKFKQPLG